MSLLGESAELSLMQIHVNGEKKEIEANSSLTHLLSSLGFAGKPVAIELNKKALTPSEIKSQILYNEDELEIIVLAPGG